MSAIPKVVALFETSLASKISSAAASLILTSATDEAGNALSGLYGIIVDEGGANQEFMLGTISGTTLTVVKRGLDPSTWSTEVTALKFEHRRGASVKITNYPILGVMRNILNGDEELPNFLKYASTVTAWAYGTRQLVTWDKAKDYVDSVAIAGVADADTVTKGAVEIATEAESQAGTDTGGTLAKLVVLPAQIAKNIQNSVYNYILSPTVYVPAFLTGDTGAQSTVATWEAVTDGSFRITINGTAYNVDAIDFSGVTDMDGVAEKIQIAIRAATSALETVVWDTNHFIISSVDTGYTSAITVLSTSTGTVGTDISGAGAADWMDCDTGNGVVTAATFAGYAITIVPAVTAYVAGQMFIWKSSAQNLGAATLNVNGLGAKDIKKNHDMALEAGDIEVGSIITVVYDGTNFQMLSSQATMPTTATLNLLSGGAASNADTVHTHSIGTLGVATAVASDNLKISSDTERTDATGGGSLVVHKKIELVFRGTYRVKFDMKNYTSKTGTARIYKNGVALGTLQSNTSNNYVTYSEDLSFAPGDTCELWIATSYSPNAPTSCKNFRIYYDHTDIKEGVQTYDA